VWTLQRDNRLSCSLVLSLLLCGCATLTPGGSRVTVYQAPLDALPPQRSMPKGCRFITATVPLTMTELDLEGQNDPFRRERNDAAAAGANALLILRQMTKARRDSECTVGLPITDCPPSFGAWFRVVIESYACTPDGLNALAALPPSTERDIGRVDVPR
jgi:hypothetical protein